MLVSLKEFSMFSGFTFLWNKQRYSFQYHRYGGGSPIRMSFFCSMLLFVCLCFVGCSGINTATNPSATNPSSTTNGITATTSLPSVALAKLHWCGKQILIFRDEGSPQSGTPTTSGTPATTGTGTPAATPVTITNWQQVEPQLGFSVYLPQTLPQGSCLISASGTIHDPTVGSIFTIGYVLPNHDAISLSEAPHASQSSTFECSPSSDSTSTKGSTPTPGPTATPVQLCTGAHGTTNIVLSARGTTASLQQLFNALQTKVVWEPEA